MQRIDYPLYVLTVGGVGAERSGCIVGFASQCSIVPPRFVVCVSKVNHTYGLAGRAPGFALHALTSEQTELARIFAEETGDRTDKFTQCRWQAGATGAPILADCAAWLEGAAVSRFSAGDHEAFVIEPVAGGSGRSGSILTYRTAPDLEPAHPVDG